MPGKERKKTVVFIAKSRTFLLRLNREGSNGTFPTLLTVAPLLP